MKLIIVRHGYTDDLAQAIVQGHRQTPLNILGRQQARRVAERLKGEKIDLVYSSDLARVVETTKVIVSHHPGVRVIYDRRLRERTSGIHEGLPHTEMRKAFLASGQEFHEYRPPQGESLIDLYDRTVAWYRDFQATTQPDQVLLVSHGGFIRSLLTYLFHGDGYKRRDEYRHVNTALSIVDIDRHGRPSLLTLNNYDHLDEATFVSVD